MSLRLGDKKRYSYSSDDLLIQNYWSKSDVYKWKESERKDNYVIDTPPPTVSGKLHVGHIFSYNHTDFIARYKRMSGFDVCYPIGFDDNGLPTERLVENRKKIKASSIGREEFRLECMDVALKEEENFRSLFKSIGLSVDWSMEYQTVSQSSVRLSQMSFLDLVKNNHAYRAKEPILWDVVDQTALSQADIEDKEMQNYMNNIIFKIDSKESEEEIVIATTRPELLPAVSAVFYHPEDERYSLGLKDRFAIVPLFDLRVPILADENVKMDKGTGLVMCASFGDQMDVFWHKKHGLSFNVIITKYGSIDEIEFGDNCINKESAQKFAKMIEGLKVKSARDEIIAILDKEGLLKSREERMSQVKCAERSGAPLEILVTDQWFIKSIEHKDVLLDNAGEINWYPGNMKLKLDNWINGVSLDWCISRQRYFGVPFPLWYSKRKGEEGKVILASADKLPVDPLTDLPDGYDKDEVECELDVMDTWATSALSPNLISGSINDQYAEDIERHNKIFPMDLRPQAHEIIRTWTFYTMLKSHLHNKSIPWKNVLISGWCRASDKSKMSKSKGNIIDPVNIIAQYGADPVRYWAGRAKVGGDTVFSLDVISRGKQLVNKIFSCGKLLDMYMEKTENLGFEFSGLDDFELVKRYVVCDYDLYFLFRLNEIVKAVTDYFELYDYQGALEIVEKFFFDDFCDNYLEITKVRAYNEKKPNDAWAKSVYITVYYGFNVIIRLFAPFLPHVTEFLYQSLYLKADADFCSLHERGNWPKYLNVYDEMIDEKRMVFNIVVFESILDVVRRDKANNNLSVKACIDFAKIVFGNNGGDSEFSFSDSLDFDIKNVLSIKDMKIDLGRDILDYIEKFNIDEVDSEQLKMKLDAAKRFVGDSAKIDVDYV